MDKVFPNRGSMKTLKEKLVGILKRVIIGMERGINFDALMGKSGFSSEAIVVNEPKE